MTSPSEQALLMYRQIVESGNEGIWVFDLEGTTAYVNTRMASMLGYTREEMSSISLLDVLDDEGRDQGAAFLARQRLAGGTTESAECLLLRSDGEPVWTVVNHSPWQDQGGRYLGLIAFVNDITERRRLSDELGRREEQLAEAQRVAHLGSWEWDIGSNELRWSDELYRIFQLAPEEFERTFENYLELVHPSDRQMTSNIVSDCLAGQPGFEFDQRIVDRVRGGVLWVRASGEVLRNDAGHPRLMRGTALDITAYKEAEERLQRATSRYRLLQTMAATANEANTLEQVSMVSVHEMCTHLNWLAGRVYLVPDGAGTLAPTGPWQRHRPDPPEVTAESAGDALEEEIARLGEVSDIAVEVAETQLPRWRSAAPGADQASRDDPLQAFAVPVLSRHQVVAVLEFIADGAAERRETLAICQEVASQLAVVAERQRTSSELQAARDTAVEALKAKSAFLATMSHEIRTPMNGVIGLADLLRATDLDDRQRQYVTGLQTAGEALLEIINDILDFSKIEAGRLELEIIDVDVTRVIEEVAGLLARQAHAKGLELITRGWLGLSTPLRGDPSRLRQVLLNLTANAIKFTDVGEVVLAARVAAAADDAVDISFEVADTGIGISQPDQRRIFQPFFQVDASVTRRFGGTGLGLAISQQLVQTMGGDLTVESRPGCGSTFRFTLHLPRARVRTAVPPRSRTPLSEGTSVLVVDDNATNRLILNEQLVAWNLSPRLADSGAAALRILHEAAAAGTPIALALLDMAMPDMDGLELARRIAEVPVLAMTRIVLLTSTDVGSAQLEGTPVSAHLHKPVRSSQLHDCLTQVMQPGSRASGREAAAPADTQQPARGRVLVVEDNAINQLVARGLLDRLGFVADVAVNGYDALAALERADYCAVLMDCQMPEMDGYTATREIRRREGVGRHTPIIAMTAGVLADDEERCLRAGMDAYLPKPIDGTHLARVLAQWVTGEPAA